MAAKTVQVDSPRVTYSDKYIESQYSYATTSVELKGGQYVATPVSTQYTFRTKRQVPKVGVMLVGIGGNNGSTVIAATIANRLGLSWHTKEGLRMANYFGSLTQASTVCLGTGSQGEEVYVPLNQLMPMLNPNDIIFDGRCTILVMYHLVCA